MTNEAQAKMLLAGSYAQSAARIRDSISRTLLIQNARAGNQPPPATGDVVGLCGQGGRHSYFRVPLGVMINTIDRIMQAQQQCGMGALSVERTIEEIAMACQDLRQQTFFDTGSGCVNDQLPSMVPLLPPEEIWLNDQELVLDVWRLISFEFDLVSNSVSAELPVEDFAFSVVSQSGLAFRILMNELGNRQVTFEVKFNNLPTSWLPTSSGQFTKDVGLGRIFFEAGSLLTPLAGDNFTRWYVAIRYLHWIDELSVELRAKDGFNRNSIDSRYRGLFAEDMGVGLMAVLLSDIFKAKPINNTVEVWPVGVSKGGPIADFIALASDPVSFQPLTIIAESKGSLGRPVSSARFARAKQQTAATNLVFAGAGQTLPLAFGSVISYQSQPANTHCLITDPPSDEFVRRPEIDPVQAWRIAYTKALKFIGLETAGQQVLRGDPAETLRPMDFDRQSDKRRGERDLQRLRRTDRARQLLDTELLLDAGGYAVGVDPLVLEVLREGIDADSWYTLSKSLHARENMDRKRFPPSSFGTSLGFGVIAYSDLDE